MSDLELQVDWIACEAFGMCHDLAPDLIPLDDWGYPVLPSGPVPRETLGDVQRIVDCCPARALRLARRGEGRSRAAGLRGRGGASRHRGIRIRA